MSNNKKLTWEGYEKKIAGQRTRGKSNVKKVSKATASPSCIMVQRMSSEPTGRSKKYEPLETREFVDFSNFEELSIDNFKMACESHYNAPCGSCDVLLSDRGPSCFLRWPATGFLKNKNFFLENFFLYKIDLQLFKNTMLKNVCKEQTISGANSLFSLEVQNFTSLATMFLCC